jgi:hypothetical protein
MGASKTPRAKEMTPMMTTTATTPITETATTIEARFAVAANAPASEFPPSPLRDTLATLFSVAGVGALVKIVLYILLLIAGH